MKLFYKPGACSLASHITLRESGKDFTLVSVDLMKKRLENGHIAAFMQRMAERPEVQDALSAEGLK
ncbi:hypothetical protein AWG53_02065 [Escherichia coli]|nr:hypothetical protein [Escherichia coli]KZH64739.1 hypothetical protein AWG53_02065 [Escherichia coli]MCN3667530.1 hypothetical protein [Escherichia coli]HDH7666302.1 hypothetical protein [Escherichia coli]